MAAYCAACGLLPAARQHGQLSQRRPARPRGLQPPAAQQQEAPGSPAGPLPSTAPSKGWLWDRKAADTRRRLQEQNLKPKKSLGQNFMLDDGVLAAITEAAGVGPGDLVLEIGPGTGNLTRHLLGAGALVTAVEKDYALSEQLEQEFAGVPELRLVCGDILRQDYDALLAGMHAHAEELSGGGSAAQQGGDGEGGGSAGGGPQQDVQQPAASASQGPRQIKVVANLPYYITKDCLLGLLPRGAAISHLYFMLQDEVGVRLTQVAPGAADWRAMNLLTQFYSEPRYLFQIDRRKYHPAPKVNGALVAFQLTPPGERLAVPSEPRFLALVKKAFSQRRKVARNALRPLYEPGQVAVALQAAGLSVDARAQDLTLAEFGGLAWALERTPADAVLPAAEAAEETVEAEEEEEAGEYAP